MKNTVLCLLVACFVGLTACGERGQPQIEVTSVPQEMQQGKKIFMTYPEVAGAVSEDPTTINQQVSDYLIPYAQVLFGLEGYTHDENLRLARENGWNYMGVMRINAWEKEPGCLTTAYTINLNIDFYDVATGELLKNTSVEDSCSARAEQSSGGTCIEPALRQWAQSLFQK